MLLFAILYAPLQRSVTNLDGFDKKRQEHSWGRVPFLILKNNRSSTTDLEHINLSTILLFYVYIAVHSLLPQCHNILSLPVILFVKNIG